MTPYTTNQEDKTMKTKRAHCKAFNETSGNWLAPVREIPCMGKPVTPNGYCQKHASRDIKLALQLALQAKA